MIDIKSLLIGLICFAFISEFRAADTASTGFWDATTTWQSGTLPGNGNTLVIPAGVTVTLNCNCGTYSGMHIIVFGTLYFPGGRKINLAADGIVDIYTGGTITGDNGGDKLIIDGNTVWRGNESDITGPTSCNSSGCGSNPTLPVELLSFDCVKRNNRIEVSWEVGSEVQHDYYTVSFSGDVDHWAFENFVYSSGLATYPKTYHESYLDDDFDYCRLRQYDINGTNEDIGLKSITKQYPPNLGIGLACNPCSDNFRFWSENSNTVQAAIRIYNTSGQLEYSTIKTVGNGVHDIVKDLAPGLYFIQFAFNGQEQTLMGSLIP
ncbi:MAG: hypothetical protein Salg2KO_09200 [Salibacteraceae bacterium]